jgi:hypothetical protein
MIDLERENAQLASMLAKVIKENGLLRNAMMAQTIRVDEDDLGQFRQRRQKYMWVVYGPSAVLPGSIFHLRRNTIAYAAENLGMTWAKCRRMGFVCEKVYLVPAAIEIYPS